jgi:O-antigen/teichoic acid export membrane protein
LQKNTFLRKSALLSSGSAAGHFFTLILSPILTRVYGPEDFATLGLFTSFLSVAGVAVTLQYETSIISASDQSEAVYLTLSAALLGIPTSLLAGCAMWFLIHNSLLGFGILPWYIPILLSFVMCFVGCFAVLRYWCLRDQSFHTVSRAVAEQTAARVIAQAGAGLLGFHDVGLIAGETLGRGVGLGRMFKSSWPEFHSHVTGFRWSECRRVLWKNRKFPLLSLPSSFIDALCIGLTVPLLIQQYGSKIGGSYALVWRVLALPSVLITLAVADTFHSQIAEMVRQAPGKVMSFFTRTSMTLLLAGIVPSAILYLWGRPLFVLAFGAQWGVAGTLAALVAPWYLGQLVVNPVSRTVLVLSGQETKLVWDVLCLVSLPVVFHIARERGLDVLGAVRLLSLVNTSLYFIYFLIVYRLIAKFHRSLIAPPLAGTVSEEVAG